jgi:hypothetical protein
MYVCMYVQQILEIQDGTVFILLSSQQEVVVCMHGQYNSLADSCHGVFFKVYL